MDEKISKKVVYSVIKKLNEFYDEIFEGIDKEKLELKPEDVYIPKDFDEFAKLWYEAGNLKSPSTVKGFYFRKDDVDSEYKGKIIINPLFAERVDRAYKDLKTYGAVKTFIDELKESISYLASITAHESMHKKDSEALSPDYQKILRLQERDRLTKEEKLFYDEYIRKISAITSTDVLEMADEGKAFFAGSLYLQNYNQPFLKEERLGSAFKEELNELFEVFYKHWYRISTGVDRYLIAKFIGALAGVYVVDLPYEKKKSIAKEIFNEKDPVEVVRKLAKLAEKGLDKIEKEGIEKFIYPWDKNEENIEHVRYVSKNLLEMIKKYYGIMFGFLGIVLLPFLLSSKTFTSNFSLVNGTTFLLFNVSILFMLVGVVKTLFQNK